MTALKSVLFGTAIGLLSTVGANAADFPPPPAVPPIYIPPPTSPGQVPIWALLPGMQMAFTASTISPVRF